LSSFLFLSFPLLLPPTVLCTVTSTSEIYHDNQASCYLCKLPILSEMLRACADKPTHTWVTKIRATITNCHVCLNNETCEIIALHYKRWLWNMTFDLLSSIVGLRDQINATPKK
jgi:hypothetical protein